VITREAEGTLAGVRIDSIDALAAVLARHGCAIINVVLAVDAIEASSASALVAVDAITQVAPFWQGDEAQSSMLTSQLLPMKPATQLQV